jgi:hypothetical protein
MRLAILCVVLVFVCPIRVAASCAVPTAPPYVDVYRIEFQSSLPTLNISDVDGYVWSVKGINVGSMLQSADLMLSGAPLMSRTGYGFLLKSSSQELFDGLLAQLARYHFFDMADAALLETSGEPSEYTITADRCGSEHTVHLNLPTDTATLDSNARAILNLFNDLVHTTLLSKWQHIMTVTT